MFYKTLIASFALHLAVFSGVAFIGTGGSSPRADGNSVLSVQLKDAPGTAPPVGQPPAIDKKPEAATAKEYEVPEEIRPASPAPHPHTLSQRERVAEGRVRGEGGTDSVDETRIASRGPSAETNCETNNDALSKIREAIERAKSYPLVARKRGLEGTVLLGFHISESGQPMDIRVVKSSGYRVLDGEAIKIVKRASPYPPLGRTVDVPINFKLEPIGFKPQ